MSPFSIESAISDLMYDGYVYVYTKDLDEIKKLIEEKQKLGLFKYEIITGDTTDRFTRIDINYGVEKR